MGIPSEPQETFEIKADILGSGSKAELDVHAVDGHYHVVFEGVQLVVIKYKIDDVEHWEMVDGHLDQEAINNIGEAIEGHFA